MPTHLPVDAHELDRLLLAVPVHVLFFDSGLICRYAAPSGPHFLGRTAEELLGVPAQLILPAELALEQRLRGVAETQQAWTAERVAYPADPGGAWPAGTWDISLQPWTLLPDGAPLRGEDGLLLSCLTHRNGTATRPPDVGVNRVGDADQAAALLERMRTQLTVIRGFAGLLDRRPVGAAGTPELARIQAAALALTRLLEDYEDVTEPYFR